MIASSRAYNYLKFVALILLPAAGTLYFALAQVWHWDNGTAVVGTITSVDTFLGLVLGISTATYNNSDAKYDGHVEVTETPTRKTFALNVNGDPNDIDQKKELLLRVSPPKTKSVSVKAKQRN